MKRTSKCTPALIIATLLLAATASAQMNMPKPGPEHKKLDYFTGSWACDSDVKPGPMGPGGKSATPRTPSGWRAATLSSFIPR